MIYPIHDIAIGFVQLRWRNCNSQACDNFFALEFLDKLFLPQKTHRFPQNVIWSAPNS